MEQVEIFIALRYKNLFMLMETRVLFCLRAHATQRVAKLSTNNVSASETRFHYEC